MDFPKKNIKDSTLDAFLNSPSVILINEQSNTLPTFCKDCVWKKICGGGQMIHRYSRKRGFNNPSVMCEGLKIFYRYLFLSMVKSGCNETVLLKNLS